MIGAKCRVSKWFAIGSKKTETENAIRQKRNASVRSDFFSSNNKKKQFDAKRKQCDAKKK